MKVRLKVKEAKYFQLWRDLRGRRSQGLWDRVSCFFLSAWVGIS